MSATLLLVRVLLDTVIALFAGGVLIGVGYMVAETTEEAGDKRLMVATYVAAVVVVWCAGVQLGVLL